MIPVQSLLRSMLVAGLILSPVSPVRASPASDNGSVGTQTAVQSFSQVIELGARPLSLVEQMPGGKLREQLQSCAKGPFRRAQFSIAHRGAPLEFAEHTRESYIAAASQGAGLIECDVTFTRDRELVCRHAQCDLHSSTNILAVPQLAAKCSEPFAAATYDENTGAQLSNAAARCCASDLSLDEFRQLRGKRDSQYAGARTVQEYLYGPNEDRNARVSGTLMTHRESIELFQQLGVQMVPELKAPEIEMASDFTQQDYARKMLDEYASAGVAPASVWPQSFSLADILFWQEQYPEFASQLIYLDGRSETPGFNSADPKTWQPGMQELADMGVRTIAPPIWMLLAVQDGEIVPSVYAQQARSAGLDIITWSLERSGSLSSGGGWYYQSVAPLVKNDGATMTALHVLAQDVGVRGVFTDWPATVTYYANCMGLP